MFWYRVFVSRITGKEEMVNLYQEEAEVFKEKNYHHKERVSGIHRSIIQGFGIQRQSSMVPQAQDFFFTFIVREL